MKTYAITRLFKRKSKLEKYQTLKIFYSIIIVFVELTHADVSTSDTLFFKHKIELISDTKSNNLINKKASVVVVCTSLTCLSSKEGTY